MLHSARTSLCKMFLFLGLGLALVPFLVQEKADIGTFNTCRLWLVAIHDRQGTDTGIIERTFDAELAAESRFAPDREDARPRALRFGALEASAVATGDV